MPGTLTGKFMQIDGVTPAKGTVLIEANVPQIVDAEGNVVFSGVLRKRLEDGAFEVSLPASDDQTLNPKGFTYTVRPMLNHTQVPAVAGITVVDGASKDFTDSVNPNPAAPAPSYEGLVNEATEAAVEAAQTADDAVVAAGYALTYATAASAHRDAAEDARDNAQQAADEAHSEAENAASAAMSALGQALLSPEWKGEKGDKGDQGDIGPRGADRFIVQSNGTYPARDFTGNAIFVGSIDPGNLMLDGDTWITPDDVPAFGAPVIGTGSPEGLVTALPGTEYIDLNATNGAVKWMKWIGSGPSGWRVTIGDTGWRDMRASFSNVSTTDTKGRVMIRRTQAGVTMWVMGIQTAVYEDTCFATVPEGWRVKNGEVYATHYSYGFDYFDGAAPGQIGIGSNGPDVTRPDRLFIRCGGGYRDIKAGQLHYFPDESVLPWPVTLPGTPV